MTLKPHLCGKNRIQMPNSGCNECEIYSIDDELLESLTPIECYQPPIVDAVVCEANVCYSRVVCGDEPIEPTCDDYGTPYWSCTSTASWKS